MAKSFDKVWSNCLDIIKDIVEWQHFTTWFEPIRPVELKDNVLVIQVPSQFFFEYLEEHYVNLLAKTLRRILGKGCQAGIQDHGRQWQSSEQAANHGCTHSWIQNIF